MLRYVIKRLLQLIPTLFLVSVIVFWMVRIIPGDPISLLYGVSESGGTSEEYMDAMREKYGLNDPEIVQYFRWITNFLKGDMGTSLYTHKTILKELTNRYQYTIILAVWGTIVGSILGVIFGIIAAAFHNKAGDNIVMVISMIAVSTPSFFLAMLFMFYFCLHLGVLPSLGLKSWKHAILPVATLGLGAVGMIARTTRSSMLDVINQDYIRTARAYGTSKTKIILRYAFKNALIPVLTAIGLRFGSLLAGAALVETIFTIPGIGSFLVDSVSKRDYPAIQSTILVLAASFVIVNTIVDILYGLVDPRVKYE
ncbi:MAG: ABC transporter permease [Lachnospiraceae bacterium]|nr:ABC transporter permease [Lachnospiraceae bacterium]